MTAMRFYHVAITAAADYLTRRAAHRLSTWSASSACALRGR
jgi:hypothetical protein